MALLGAYKDISVYLIFYTIIIISWAYLGSIVISYDSSFIDPNYPNQPVGYDLYASNFNSFTYMIMQQYALATYDNYPDVQIPAIQYD